jgi:hypothetical protein
MGSKTACPHDYHDEEVSTNLTALFKRPHAHTPNRRYGSPRRSILIATKYMLAREQGTRNGSGFPALSRVINSPLLSWRILQPGSSPIDRKRV